MGSRRLLAWSLVAASFAAPFITASCGSGKASGTGGASAGTAGSSATTQPSGASSSSGTPGDGGTGGGVNLGDGSMTCSTGQACGDGGVCAGSTCCDADLACGDVCCPASQVCSFQKCVTPGAPCTDSSDCNPGEYCESALGSDAGAIDSGCVGAMMTTGHCLPTPPTCAADAGAPDSGAITCLEQCTYHPTGTFNPTLKYSWGGVITPPFNTDVMMAPIVLPLEDTNCDGKIDGRDVPSIVFTSFTNKAYTSNGTLHAIRVVNGALADRWAATAVVDPSTQLAGGEIDGNPGNEIVACGVPYKVNDAGANMVDVMAFNGADGTLLWSTTITGTCSMPAIADLDGDGKVEVVVEGAILDGATGAVKVVTNTGLFVLADIDGDGKLDIVTGNAAYHSDGTKFASVTTMTAARWPAIGDLDLDGKPEVISVEYSTHEIAVWHYDPTSPTKATILRDGVDINGAAPQHCLDGSAGYTAGGGPPTVADFNGDGVPDVALAGGIGYTILDGKKLMNNDPSPIIWTSVTTDCSSAATGSSVFDFDGKGIAQAVYSDEDYLRIYDGTDGGVIWQTCNTTGTLEELPVVVDVDNDGHADIVVVSNAYAASPASGAEIHCSDQADGGAPYGQAGIRVFSDANATWVRTRSIWNQHSYHVTNVNDDGTIPQNELPNWTQPGLNDFRQNKAPGLEFAASDLVVSIAPVCPGPSALAATVRNIGQAAVPAGVVVGFYAGAPPGTVLGQASTTQVLYPAESQIVVYTLTPGTMSLVNGGNVFAKVDDSPVPHPSWHECNTANNVSTPVSSKCSGAQ